MGELQAYVLPVGALDAVLAEDPDRRERVRRLVGPVLGPASPPSALGPIHRRVPGTPVLRDDDPTPADLDGFVAGEPAPAGRGLATWRLVEALLTALAVAEVRTTGARPAALAPLGLPLPAAPDRTAGRWSPSSDPSPAPLREALAAVAVADQAHEVVVVWSAGTG